MDELFLGGPWEWDVKCVSELEGKGSLVQSEKRLRTWVWSPVLSRKKNVITHICDFGVKKREGRVPRALRSSAQQRCQVSLERPCLQQQGGQCLKTAAKVHYWPSLDVDLFEHRYMHKTCFQTWEKRRRSIILWTIPRAHLSVSERMRLCDIYSSLYDKNTVKMLHISCCRRD